MHVWKYRYREDYCQGERPHRFYCANRIQAQHVIAIADWLDVTFGFNRLHYLASHGGTDELFESTVDFANSYMGVLFKLRWSA